MSLEILESQIRVAVSAAATHAAKCEDLIASLGLVEALSYCAGHQVDPPQCSVTAQSENAAKLRTQAARKLSDPAWWSKQLEVQAVRSYEANEMRNGRVTNYVSDGLAAYRAKHRK